MYISTRKPRVDLVTITLFIGAPLPRSIILTSLVTVPVNRTTATIVKPPFVAILKVRGPASRYCDLVLLKLTCPLPFGPPVALYVGRMADPRATLLRVNTDANDGLVSIRATNLSQAVVEYGPMKFPPV